MERRNDTEPSCCSCRSDLRMFTGVGVGNASLLSPCSLAIFSRHPHRVVAVLLGRCWAKSLSKWPRASLVSGLTASVMVILSHACRTRENKELTVTGLKVAIIEIDGGILSSSSGEYPAKLLQKSPVPVRASLEV